MRRFLIEGAWNGPFAATQCIVGSGLVLADDVGIAVTSCATTDLLSYTTAPGHVWVSNLLPFLLAATNDTLDPAYPDYRTESIIRGIDAYDKTLRDHSPHFDTYAAYVDYLDRQHQALVQYSQP